MGHVYCERILFALLQCAKVFAGLGHNDFGEVGIFGEHFDGGEFVVAVGLVGAGPRGVASTLDGQSYENRVNRVLRQRSLEIRRWSLFGVLQADTIRLCSDQVLLSILDICRW